MTFVSEAVKEDATKFLAQLLHAAGGIYFLDADDEKGLPYLTGWDYRNETSKGLVLFLAATFSTKSDFQQVKGRV